MLSIDDYVDAAKAKLGLSSNTQLSLELGMSKSSVNFWIARKSLPSDGMMVKVAEYGEKDVDKALLHLNWWRSVHKNEHDAANHYRHMIESHFLAA